MLFGILLSLIVPVLVIFLLVKVIIGLVKKKSPSLENSSTALSLSKEDSVSQSFFLLSVLFFCVGALLINRNFGSFFAWQTIVLLTSLVAFFITYYFKALYCSVIGIFTFFIWWIGRSSEWITAENKTAALNVQSISILTGSVLLLLILYLAGKFHSMDEKYKRFTYTYQVLSIVPLIFLLFFLSSQFGLESLRSLLQGKGSFMHIWQLTISLLLFLFVFVFSLSYSFFKKTVTFAEAITLSLLALFFLLLAFSPEQKLLAGYSYGYGNTLTGQGIFFAIILNIAAFIQLIALILFGYSKKEIWLINLGAGSLFIFIIIKYFDWFFSFLDKSVFFIGAGILLFAVGWFMERGRRMMISNIKNSTDTNIQFS